MEHVDALDPFKCGALLHQGEWLDPGSRWTTQSLFQNWQPPGCLMHEYNQRDIHECLYNRKLVFIGDSTTRQIFWAVAKKMDRQKAERNIAENLARDKKHMDLEFEVYGVTLQFIWDPWLNSTGLDRELKKFSAVPVSEPTGASGESPALLLLGAPGLWFALHNQENYMRDFRDAVERVIPYMDHASGGNRDTKPQSFNARQGSPNFLLMAPIQVPQYEYLSPARAATITPEKIDLMNDFLQQASAYSDADIVWSYNLMTYDGKAQYEESGIHVVDNVARAKADVLLNIRCNAGLASSKYPFDRTCCSNYTSPNLWQWSFMVAGMLVLPICLWLRKSHFAWLRHFLPSVKTLTPLAIFFSVICFSFYADRTQIFEKSQKQFRPREFALACLGLGVAGLLSIESSRHPSVATKGAPRDQLFLSRSQTDEWKGWMQIVILIYHYTHASSTLWIYEVVRVLVASYLFMTGYVHTTYFLTKADYSSRRLAAVLVRLNLLSCVLPYMMRTDYLNYYFSPLVSFWFLVIYLTLFIDHKRNDDLSFLLSKIVLSAIMVTCFVKVPGILESVCFILNRTCSISWNVIEWRFRMSLDLYIVYVGMIVAALVVRRSKLKPSAATPTGVIDKAIHLSIDRQGTFSFTATIASLSLLSCFWTLAQRALSKEEHNRWQPYVSFIPILSFVALRNCHSFLRNHHSAAFAWLGRCSLETYILQYHIWLAGDTKGLLSLGLGSRLADALILTPLFLWISWHTANVTQTLAGWMVGDTTPRRGTDKDVEMEDNAAPHILSPFRERAATYSKERGVILGKLQKGVERIWSDVRWRLCGVLLLMWVANVTYR